MEGKTSEEGNCCSSPNTRFSSSDPEFSLAFRESQMAKLLEQVRQQTEETQELLKAAICHADS